MLTFLAIVLAAYYIISVKLTFDVITCDMITVSLDSMIFSFLFGWLVVFLYIALFIITFLFEDVVVYNKLDLLNKKEEVVKKLSKIICLFKR